MPRDNSIACEASFGQAGYTITLQGTCSGNFVLDCLCYSYLYTASFTSLPIIANASNRAQLNLKGVTRHPRMFWQMLEGLPYLYFELKSDYKKEASMNLNTPQEGTKDA
eukprot:5462206-Amphidinium_carterae.1